MTHEDVFSRLRDAYPPESESCHAALMDAARHVKEDVPMKRFSLRTLAVTLILLAAMTVAALAAGSLLGWGDYLSSQYGAALPDSAVQVMRPETPAAWQVGPLTFTAQETLADSHIALASLRIAPAEGAQGLVCVYPDEPMDALGDTGAALAQALGVDPGSTWAQAAQALSLPLYAAEGFLDLDTSLATGEMMMDYQWNADGSLVYYSLASLNTHAMAGQTELPLDFFLRVVQIDPATGKALESWQDDTAQTAAPVAQLLAEKTYAPQGGAAIAGFTLENIQAQRYVTGLYLTLTYAASEDAEESDAYALYELALTDEAGQAFPSGPYLSGNMDTSAWPQVRVTTTLGLDELPETLTLTDGTERVTVK